MPKNVFLHLLPIGNIRPVLPPLYSVFLTMRCLDFFDRSIDEAIATARSDQELVAFVHLPKTAGSSVQRDLHFEFPGNYHIPSTSMEESWRKFEEALEREDNRQIHHVRGHLTHLHLEKLDARKIRYRAVSFLRHPLDRLISHFNWLHTTIKPSVRSASPPRTFEDFVRARLHNYMTERLVGRCESLDQALEKVNRRYWFIGLTEYYHLCQFVMMNALGTTYQIRPRHNRTKGRLVSTVGEIDNALLEEIATAMSIDFGVFEHFRQKWERKCNEIAEMIMRNQFSHAKRSA